VIGGEKIPQWEKRREKKKTYGRTLMTGREELTED